VRVFGREIIHKKREFVNKKLTFSDRWLMLALGSFDSGDIDSEMVRKHRAIAAIEPIKSDTGFVADSLGSFDGYWSSSGFILAISVLFQICAPREFSLINSESLTDMAKSRRDMLGILNRKTPFRMAFHLKGELTLG